MIIQDLFEEQQSCPHCGGPMFSEMLMMEKKDACYYKVKASAKVWPSAYASGRLVQCRKKGAGNYGNKSEGVAEEYELAGVGVAYELGRRAYKERKTARDNPYSATREARKNDEWAKGLERGKHDANDARHFRSSVREQGMAEGKVEPQVDHRGDVDLDADIEVLGVDYNTGTWKITYNGKPYTVKADYFSREDLSRWQIPDYDVEIINRNGQNIMKVIDWDNEGSSKTDRQIRMVNTIIAYLDTENAQDIQYMAWKDQELDNVTAHEFYNDIRDFYHKDQQKIDQTVQWLLKNMTNDEAREGLADYIKNPVNPMDWNTKENLKNNRTYLMYVAFSYSREGNTEMTPGMNLPKIQLNDPDDEDELQYQLDALFKKVDLKFDAFENKIVELSKKFSLPNPDLGSGMGNREMFWELICQTAWPKEYKYIRTAATNILNFKAAVDKYAKSFNSSLIKIGLPGISEYAIWYGVLSDDLTEQQVNYFATPEGFANVANGKIDVSKMINDNMQRKSLEEKLGDNRPKLGSKRDMGKSIRKWRKTRGLDETDQVNEKSVSQAQFRTMAAAAHNPKFAKKVGIKQSVAKEFNQADKGSNYKKLPDRTNEGGDVFMANIKDTPEYKAGFATGKLPVPHPEGTQQYASYYKGVIDKASPTLNKVGEGELDEGWKSALGAAALAGTMAMGGGAHARVSGDYVDNPEINRLTGQPKVTQQISPDAAKPAVTKPGFSKEYLQSVVDGTHPRPLISKERAQELLQQQTTNEQGEQQKGADYRDPPEADYGDDYQDMVARMKKLAGLGPLKTVYDPAKRVYRNIPTAVQPKK